MRKRFERHNNDSEEKLFWNLLESPFSLVQIIAVSLGLLSYKSVTADEQSNIVAKKQRIVAVIKVLFYDAIPQQAIAAKMLSMRFISDLPLQRSSIVSLILDEKAAFLQRFSSGLQRLLFAVRFCRGVIAMITPL